VVRQVLPGTPRAALLSAAADAQLLVVGARGRGGFDEMSLGSIAEAVLLYAPGPVAVVRQGLSPSFPVHRPNRVAFCRMIKDLRPAGAGRLMDKLEPQ
jgi:hypothetical protein